MSRPDTLAARLAIGIAALWLLGGCTAGSVPAPTPSTVAPTAQTSTSAGPTIAPSPTTLSATPVSTDPPTPAPSVPSPTADPGTSLLGQVVETLADDGLRVRTEPRVSDDSTQLEPLLPLGTRLLVLDGPVSASGYAWYEVFPLSTTSLLPSGWVASSGRDGAPWVAAVPLDCPPVPTDLGSLAALPRGVGLACFPREPITVEARIVDCGCDADGPGYTPSWFFLGSGSPVLLVDPDLDLPPDAEYPDDWFVLNLDPDGEHPAVLPLGDVVEITGIYDHPAATTCTVTEWDGTPEPSQRCRLEFAVTRVAPSGR